LACALFGAFSARAGEQAAASAPTLIDLRQIGSSESTDVGRNNA